MTDSKIIFDGNIKKSDEAAIPVTSRGLMYGDGCFETFRSYSGRFLKLDKHLKRLSEGLNFLDISHPESLRQESLIDQVTALLQQNNLVNDDAVVRVQVWREGKRGYTVKDNSISHFSIVASPLDAHQKIYQLATVDAKRIPSRSLPAQYKLTNGINYILAAKQARAQKADGALMETIDHHVSETTIANIFWLKNNTVYTPSIDCDILPGITRDIIIHLLRNKMSLNVKEGAFGISQVKKAGSVFVCNSVKEIAPVSQIDDCSFQTESSFFQRLNKVFNDFRNKQLV